MALGPGALCLPLHLLLSSREVLRAGGVGIRGFPTPTSCVCTL